MDVAHFFSIPFASELSFQMHDIGVRFSMHAFNFKQKSVIDSWGSTRVPGHCRRREERTRLRRLQGNHDESPNPMCAPARSITRGVHHSEPPFSFLPARGPLVPRLTFEITDLFSRSFVFSLLITFFFLSISY